jgi:hypothetical protein
MDSEIVEGVLSLVDFFTDFFARVNEPLENSHLDTFRLFRSSKS